MLALGISAIGKVGPAYYQNVKTLKEYYERIDAGALPVVRGLELSPDDLLRRKVIHALACNFRVPTDGHGVDFPTISRPSLASCASWRDDGLVEISPDAIVVTPKGRLLVRSICMVFDRYLREKRERATYSNRLEVALFALGFRPLYLLAGLYAALGVPLWALQYSAGCPPGTCCGTRTRCCSAMPSR